MTQINVFPLGESRVLTTLPRIFESSVRYDCRDGPVATPRSDSEEMSKQKSKRLLFGIRIFNVEVVIVLGLSGEGGKSMVEVLGVFWEYLLASS